MPRRKIGVDTATNYVTYPNFQGSGTTATGWVAYTSGTTAGSRSVSGNKQTITVTSLVGGNRRYGASVGNGANLPVTDGRKGDRLFVGCKVDVTGVSGNTRAGLYTEFRLNGVALSFPNFSSIVNGRVEGTAVAPGEYNQVAAYLWIESSNGADFSGSSTVVFSEYIITRVRNFGDSPTYFDGNTTSGTDVYAWAGAANASQSTRTYLDPTMNRQAPTGRTIPTKRRQPVEELVYNGDFEYAPVATATTTSPRFIDGTSGGSTNNDVYGWGFNSGSVGGFSGMFDTTEFYSGSRSLKLSTTAINSSADVSYGTTSNSVGLKQRNILVSPNTSYTCSFMMKTNLISGTDSLGACGFFFEYRADGATSNFDNSTVRVKTTTGWTKYTVTFTTAATTVYIAPRFQARGNGGAGTLIMDAWFDNISVKRTTPTTRVLIT